MLWNKYILRRREYTDSLVEYFCKNLANCYLDYSDSNKIDIIFRKIYLLPDVAVKHFGVDNLSEALIKDYENGKNIKHEFIHAVLPKRYLNEYKSSLSHMKYLSYYIESSSKILAAEHGYKEFPYIVARWFTSPNSVYGESPSMLVLPDIKCLMQYVKLC